MSVQPSKLLAQCPLCQAQYQEADIRLLEEQGVSRLFHCTCQSCGHAMLAVVLEASGIVSSVGLVTDLGVEDAKQFRSLTTIGSDECIQMHTLLEERSFELCQALLRA